MPFCIVARPRALVLVIIAVDGVLVAVTEPAIVPGAFVIGAVSPALATASLRASMRPTTERPRPSAWLGAARSCFAILWNACALVQTVTACRRW